MEIFVRENVDIIMALILIGALLGGLFTLLITYYIEDIRFKKNQTKKKYCQKDI